MSSLSNNAENRAGDWLNPAVAVPVRPIAPLRLLLCIGDPGEGAVPANEVVDTGYVRQNIEFPAMANGSAANTLDVTFGLAAVAYTVSHVAIVDSTTGTPLHLWKGPLTASVLVAVGNQFRMIAGALTLSMA